MALELSIYDIIRGPRMTEKAYRMNQVSKKLVLDVHPKANKLLIAEALKKLFNVEIEKIGTKVRKGKNKRSGRHKFKGTTSKQAIITLKEGYSVDLMNMVNVQNTNEQKP